MRSLGWKLVLALLAAIRWAAGADAPLNPPAPLAPVPGAISPGKEAATFVAARDAHDLGLPDTAAVLYRKLLDALPAAPAPRSGLPDRRTVELALATSLLDAGEAAEAERALAAMGEPHDAAWLLRHGLAALQLRRRADAQAAWDSIKPEEVTPEDRPWYWFFTGALYDTAGDATRANDFYHSAENAAPTELARLRFQLAADIVRLRMPAAARNPDEVRRTRENAERLEGAGRVGYAITTAAWLASSGSANDAVDWLNRMLLLTPAQERANRDELLFALGIIGDRSRPGGGRKALLELLNNGVRRDRQLQALQLLADASRGEPERAQFRAELRKLGDARPPHPLVDAILYYRAQFALAEKDFRAADVDAERLVKDFPASLLRVHALTLLTQSAWEQGRYRLAASNARRAREALAAGSASAPKAQAELGIVEAEAWFRAGQQAGEQATVDFRSAADAYAALLHDRPAGIEARQLGTLMFQHVLAEIKADSVGAAATLLDRYEHEEVFDQASRWQAEWSLARALEIAGDIPAALARVSKLLATSGEGAASLDPMLRVRLGWLQTKLAFEAGRYADVLAFADRLLASLGEIDPKMRDEIASTVVLLRARTEFADKNEAQALETLNKLRTAYPKTDAAIYSYLVAESYFEAQGKIQPAQLQLTALTDNEDYAKSEYLPLALVELARLSEQLGQLEAANRYIEQFVDNPRWAAHDLIFTARLKQGDLLRRLNQFPAAQRTYEYLVNHYPGRRDVVFAQLRLAETHNAMSSTDEKNAAIARLKFEELRDRADAPDDVRVEAGYNLGELLARSGDPQGAIVTWQRDVITPFLTSKDQPFEAGATRPYWLARTLIRMGELFEQQEKSGEARAVYRLILDKNLGSFENVAVKKLHDLGVSPTKP